MSDLISKQAAREALLDKGQSSRRYKLGESWELNWFEIEDALSSIPTIEAEAVKHACWVELNEERSDGSKKYQCSRCSEIVAFHPEYLKQGKAKYCIGCGAKMDGGADNEHKRI